MSTDGQKKFAADLMRAIDEVDTEEVFRLLQRILVDDGDSPSREKYSKYFIVMDIVRMFGGAPNMTRDQAERLLKLIELALKQAFKDGVPDKLPGYPGLKAAADGRGAEGLNILHLIALFTQPNPTLAQGFMMQVGRCGLLKRELIRAPIRLSGAIPLHLAAEVNNKAVAELLLSRDPYQNEIRNNEDLLASEIAFQAGNNSLASFLEETEKKYLQAKIVREATDNELRNKLGSGSDQTSMNDQNIEVAPIPVLSGADRIVMMLSERGVSEDSNTNSPGDDGTVEMMNDDNMTLLSGILREAASSGPQSSPPRDPRGCMVDQEMEEPDNRTRDREVEIQNLGTFIKDVCETIPGGDEYWHLYWEFLNRFGITTVKKLTNGIERDPSFVDRLPVVFRDRIVELMTL